MKASSRGSRLSRAAGWLVAAGAALSLVACALDDLPAPAAKRARATTSAAASARPPRHPARADAHAKGSKPARRSGDSTPKEPARDDDAREPAKWGVADPAPSAAVDPNALPPELVAALDPDAPDDVSADPASATSATAGSGAPPDVAIAPPGRLPRGKLVNRFVDGLAGAIERGTGPRLAALAKETWVRAEPKRRSRRIGYLRAGAIVQRSEDPVGTDGCEGGWYAIEPNGFVCADKTATLDLDAPIVRATTTRPKMDGLPYDYVIARLPGPAFYTRIPTRAEQQKIEPDLGFHLREARALERDPSYFAPALSTAIPAFLAPPDGGQAPIVPALADAPPRGHELTAGEGRPRAGFALLESFTSGDRAFGLTTDLTIIPLDRTRAVKPSTFHGLELGGEISLPVAFVMKHHATRYAEGASGQMTAGAELDYREAIPITGREKGGGAWLETKDGGWLRADDVRRIDGAHRMPAWATNGRKWIDVSILKQSLVAYEGTTPLYVTLVSTGADGIGDPKTTHSTIQGVFLIHTKHVTVTMDNDDAGDAFDLRDVPFVQYFTAGYALHAAYWHDDFGTPRSHGCVNMSPIDAAWMFGFTTPGVPDGWHAALSLHKGTIVYTHP